MQHRTHQTLDRSIVDFEHKLLEIDSVARPGLFVELRVRVEKHFQGKQPNREKLYLLVIELDILLRIGFDLLRFRGQTVMRKVFVVVGRDCIQQGEMAFIGGDENAVGIDVGLKSSEKGSDEENGLQDLFDEHLYLNFTEKCSLI